jgi:hypothetical protein
MPGKITSYPQDTTPTVDDQVLTVDIGTGSNRKVALSDLITLFFNNQPAAAATSTTLAQDTMFDFVKGGTGAITADSVGVTRNGSISAITAYQNGQKLTISAVAARSFTASKDTYVDILNTAGVGSLVYTEVTNNAASPALAANSIRLGVVVTGATTIATTASINQGQEDRVLPIASSVPYTTTDSLGNLICPRDPFRKLLGYKQVTANQTSASLTAVAMAALSCPIIVPTTRKIKITISSDSGSNNTLNDYFQFTVWDGTVGSGTQVVGVTGQVGIISQPLPTHRDINITPATTSKTYNTGINALGGGTATFSGSSVTPGFIRIELD